MIEDFEACYRFMRSRDSRYDGHFFVGVTSTGIYCRPSCPARLPRRRNVRLFQSAAAAQDAGLRACKRCDPDAAPGSPAWDRRADVAGRAVRLIADGEVDREGVPGLRVPACVDGFELAVRAVIGQQISVAAARTVAGRLVEQLGEPLAEPVGTVTHRFPTSTALARLEPATLPMPRTRAETLRRLAGLVAGGDLSLGAGADREATVAKLLSVPGIGPWTASYVAMRALGDPDAYPSGDVALRRALERLGCVGRRAEERLIEEWRPWRSYAVVHLWRSLAETPSAATVGLSPRAGPQRSQVRTIALAKPTP